MGRPSKIPERLEAAVLTEAGKGLGTRQIAEWLKATHKVDVGHAAVARLLNRLREDRKSIAQAVVREELAPRLTADIQVLTKHVTKLDRVATGLAATMLDDNGNPTSGIMESVGRTPTAKLYADVVAQIQRSVEMVLEFSGAGSDPEATARPVIMIPPESED